MATGLIQPFMYDFGNFLVVSSLMGSLLHFLSVSLLSFSLYLSLPLSVWMCCLWAIIRVDRLVGGSL